MTLKFYFLLPFLLASAGCDSRPKPTTGPASASSSLGAPVLPVSASAPASSAAPPGSAPAASSSGSGKAAPLLSPSKWAPPETPSKPPTVAEWQSAEDVDVRNAKRLGCEVRMVREWLRVSCRTTENSSTKIMNLKWVDPKDKPLDFYDMVKPGTLASIVFPIRKDTSVRVEFEWIEFSRQLTIKWAPGTPQPVVYFTGDAPMDLSKPNCVMVCGLPFFPGRGTMPCPPTHDPTNDEVNGCICRAFRDGTCASDW